MKLVILGNPIPKQRHRHFVQNGRSYTYDAQTEIKKLYKHQMKMALRRNLDSGNRGEVLKAAELARSSSFEVDLTFHTAPPASWSQTRRKRAAWGLEVPNTKPDIDNLEKFVLDCANGILFADDKMVISIKSKKLYANEPKTIIEIKKIKPMKVSDKQKRILALYSADQIQNLEENVNTLISFMHDSQCQERLNNITQTLGKIAVENSKEFSKIKKIMEE